MNNNTSTNAIRTAFEAYLQHSRHDDAEEMVRFAETSLSTLIREHVDAHFGGIFAETERPFYERVRKDMAVKPAMRADDQTTEYYHSKVLRAYMAFLRSKDFAALQPKKEKKRQAKPKPAPETPPQQPEPTPAPKREETEGERKHVEYERVHRSPQLREACIRQWGYQCQCCGMRFDELYGEDLGADFIEVHHLQMISTFDDQRPADYVANLVPLCANCHAMIHRGADGPLTLSELRAAYRGPRWPLAKTKEDAPQQNEEQNTSIDKI